MKQARLADAMASGLPSKWCVPNFPHVWSHVLTSTSLTSAYAPQQDTGQVQCYKCMCMLLMLAERLRSAGRSCAFETDAQYLTAFAFQHDAFCQVRHVTNFHSS